MGTWATNLELATLGDDDLCGGLTAGRTLLLDGLDNVESLGHGTEHNVLAVEPVGLDGAQEELGTVGVGSSVGHGENTGSGVLREKNNRNKHQS